MWAHREHVRGGPEGTRRVVERALRGATVSDELVEELAAAGLAGIEVHHRDHTKDDVERALGLARRHGLVVTGSSDYHGTGKLNRLGDTL